MRTLLKHSNRPKLPDRYDGVDRPGAKFVELDGLPNPLDSLDLLDITDLSVLSVLTYPSS